MFIARPVRLNPNVLLFELPRRQFVTAIGSYHFRASNTDMLYALTNPSFGP
jgi:hypothetical protein